MALAGGWSRGRSTVVRIVSVALLVVDPHPQYRRCCDYRQAYFSIKFRPLLFFNLT